MANTIVEMQLSTSLSSPTLELYALDDDSSLANSGGADTLTEETNADGFWRATVTEALAGVYRATVIDGGSAVATGYVILADDTSTYRVESSYTLAALNAGATLTSIPWNSAWDAEVQSECNDALVAIHLDHLLAEVYDAGSKPGNAGSLLNEMLQEDPLSGKAQFTAEAIELSPSSSTVEQSVSIIEATVNT